MTMLDHALAYARRGLYIFPLWYPVNGQCSCPGWQTCKSKGKHPMTAHGVEDASCDEGKVTKWWTEQPRANIGLALGKSGLVAVDADIREKWDGRRWIGAMESYHGWPETWKATTGSGGLHLIFRAREGVKYTGKAETGVDVKSGNGYVVAAPSMHASGSEYVWDVGPEHCDPADVPEWLAEIIEQRARPVAVRAPRPVHRVSGGDDEPWVADKREEIRSALAFIPPEDRNDWLLIGFALHSEFPDSFGFGLWDEWSQTTSVGNYDARDQRRTWDSFHDDGGINIESLFFKAREHGWTGYDPPTVDEEEPEIARAMIRKLEEEKAQAQEKVAPVASETVKKSAPKNGPEPFPEELFEVGGLVGDVMRWMDQCAVHPAPVLSLAASLTLVGAVCGRFYRGPTGLRGNLYTIAIARTGVGKENGRKCQASLLSAAGLDKVLGPDDVSSGPGIITEMQSHPVRLFRLDEFGMKLKILSAKNSASWEKSIMSIFMRLYSSSDGVWAGTGVASSKTERKPIHMPHLSIYATSTPSEFYESLTSSSVVNGLLNRTLIIECDHGQIRARRDARGYHDIPLGLAERLGAIGSGDTVAQRAGGPMALLQTSESPPPFQLTVPLSAEAGGLYDALLDWQTDKINSSQNPDVWNRTVENTLRVALVVAVGLEPINPTITTEAWGWAERLVKWSLGRLDRSATVRIADSEHERLGQRVLEWVEAQGGIVTQTELNHRGPLKGQKLTLQKEVVAGLVHEGRIEEIKEKSTGGRPKTVYRIPDRGLN